jgi:hypothetical protein
MLTKVWLESGVVLLPMSQVYAGTQNKPMIIEQQYKFSIYKVYAIYIRIEPHFFEDGFEGRFSLYTITL